MFKSEMGFPIAKVDEYNGYSDYSEDAEPKQVETGECKHGHEYLKEGLFFGKILRITSRDLC